jgi:hypothetical protein
LDEEKTRTGRPEVFPFEKQAARSDNATSSNADWRQAHLSGSASVLLYTSDDFRGGIA